MAAGASRGNLGSLTVAIGANTEGLTQVINEIKKTNTAIRSLGTRISNQSKKIEDAFGKAAKSTKKLRSETDKAAASTKKQEALLAREIKTIASAEERTKSLTSAIKRAGASEGDIRRLNSATRTFRTEVKGAEGNTLRLAVAQTKLSKRVGDTRRRLSAFNTTIRKKEFANAAKDAAIFKDKMQDLTKSIQLALGPLSGVASRVTAFAGLANKNTIAIAGMIGALVGLFFILKKTLQAGSAFEIQFKRIEAQLELTGRAAIFSAKEVNKIAEEVADATLTNAKTARQAASALLFFNKITKKDFKTVLNLAQSLSAVLGGDLVQSAKRIGRAIQDPNEGLSSLNRQLALLTPREEDTAKALSLLGREAESTAFIIDRLASKLKDLGELEAAGVAGAFDTLLERIGRFFEIAGEAGGILQPFTDALLRISEKIAKVNKGLAELPLGLRAFGAILRAISATLSTFIENIDLMVIILGGFLATKILSKLATGFVVLATAVNRGTFAVALFNIATGRLGLVIALGAAVGIAAFRFKQLNKESDTFFTRTNLEKNLINFETKLEKVNKDLERFRRDQRADDPRIKNAEAGKKLLEDRIREERKLIAVLKQGEKISKKEERKPLEQEDLFAQLEVRLSKLDNTLFALRNNFGDVDNEVLKFAQSLGLVKLTADRTGTSIKFLDDKTGELGAKFRREVPKLIIGLEGMAREEKRVAEEAKFAAQAVALIEPPIGFELFTKRFIGLARELNRGKITQEEFNQALDQSVFALNRFDLSISAALDASRLDKYQKSQKAINDIIAEMSDPLKDATPELRKFNEQLRELEKLREARPEESDLFNLKLQKMRNEVLRNNAAMQTFANTVSSGFAQGILQGDKLSDVLGRIGDRLAEAALQALIFKAIMSEGFLGFLNQFPGVTPSAGVPVSGEQQFGGGDFLTTGGTPTGTAPPRSATRFSGGRGGDTNIFIDAREADPGVEARVARAIARSGIQQRAISANNSFEARRRA